MVVVVVVCTEAVVDTEVVTEVVVGGEVADDVVVTPVGTVVVLGAMVPEQVASAGQVA